MRTPGDDTKALMRSWYRDAIHQPFSLTHGEGNRAGALLIHGFTGSPADMRALGDAVHARGLDVYVMRLPGMASEIDRLNEMTAEIWRDAVLRQWAEHRERYERTLLLGYSMGGALALLAAAEEPPDVSMLIAPLTRLKDPRAALLPVAKYVMRGVRPYARLKWDDPRVHEWFDRARPSMLTRDPEHQRVLEHEAIYSARMLDQLRRLLVQARRSAPKVIAPTIIMQGINDRIVLRRDTRALITRLGGPVTYRELAGDHYLPLPTFDGWSRLCPVIDGELRAWMEINAG